MRKYELGLSFCPVLLLTVYIERYMSSIQTSVVHHRVYWLTCVTSGSKSLSTVRVRISRLLGSHFNRMGEVAVVMVSVGRKKNNRSIFRTIFCCEKLWANISYDSCHIVHYICPRRQA